MEFGLEGVNDMLAGEVLGIEVFPEGSFPLFSLVLCEAYLLLVVLGQGVESLGERVAFGVIVVSLLVGLFEGLGSLQLLLLVGDPELPVLL